MVVLGARCAGAATAMLLARAGHDVALVDRATFPSDTTSTHSLVRGGVVQLARWGLLDEVLASGAPPIRSVAFHRYDPGAPAPVSLAVKPRAGVDHMLAPRRHVLDAILVRAAVRAGATLLDATAVSDVRRDPSGRVVGVVARGRSGGAIDAQLVIGADGVRSRLATKFGAAVVQRYAPSGVCLYSYVAADHWDGFEFHLADGAFAGVFPTHGGQACVWLIQPTGHAGLLLGSGARRLDAWLGALEEHVPGLAEKVRAGTVTEPLRGAIGLPNHVRQAAGPGWALVGDAGYHRDPITGHGMTDAFRDAELLAEAADLALQEPSAEAAAMTTYERQRDAALAETFRITRELGAFPPPDRFASLQTELSRALDVEAQQLAARPLTIGRALAQNVA
ncbi:NAD(P)/FAD-dependent oxidoreductase [Microlunatus ginsengisoli]|uniref:NAD(P)/FAD-dependent oxidoreductase n=1 Tax=Microlunatus ginsengisoli TaxID=363863 RepID=A0ABP7AIQ5_9ACTN